MILNNRTLLSLHFIYFIAISLSKLGGLKDKRPISVLARAKLWERKAVSFLCYTYTGARARGRESLLSSKDGGWMGTTVADTRCVSVLFPQALTTGESLIKTYSHDTWIKSPLPLQHLFLPKTGNEFDSRNKRYFTQVRVNLFQSPDIN